MEKNANKILYLPYLTLVGGLFLLAIKFVAWWWTNSNALLTDALESIINIVAGVFAIYSLTLSLKPKDLNHPYGHGKVEFISAGFEGALILVAGLVIIVKSAWDFFHPYELHALDWGLGIAAFSGLANYLMGYALAQSGRATNSIALEAGGEHLKSDAYSSAGLVLGLAVVAATGWVLLDNILAIVFGLVIIYTGYGLVRRSVAGIMDEADDQLIIDFLEKINGRRQEDWVDMHNLRIIRYGSSLHLDCHLTVPWYYDTRQSHDAMKDFEDTIKTLSNRPIELFVHVDPCEPFSCALCQKTNCPERAHPFIQKVDWDFTNTTANTKHLPQKNENDTK